MPLLWVRCFIAMKPRYEKRRFDVKMGGIGDMVTASIFS